MAVYLNTLAYFLPDGILDNHEISELHPEWSMEKIMSKIGVERRHKVCSGITAGDLAYHAAEKLFQSYPDMRQRVDFVILCTQSPDYYLPSTACLLQHRLGLSRKCGAFDYNLGCSGFIYGLGLAKGLLQTNQASCVLMLTGETYTQYIHPLDKSNKTIFGDAGAAALLSTTLLTGGLNAEVLDFCYGTDGTGAESLIVRNGSARHPICDGIDKFDDDGNFIRNDNNLFMDGKAIFNFTAFQIPPLIKETLLKNGVSLDSVDYFIFHQANEFMLDTVRKRCAIPKEKFFIDIRETGNTVSNTIPIALCKAQGKGVLDMAHTILLAGFGVGLSMGAVVLKR